MREFVQKFPVLGDIPVLGMLFRSQQYLSGQSELVIFDMGVLRELQKRPKEAIDYALS